MYVSAQLNKSNRKNLKPIDVISVGSIVEFAGSLSIPIFDSASSDTYGKNVKWWLDSGNSDALLIVEKRYADSHKKWFKVRIVELNSHREGWIEAVGVWAEEKALFSVLFDASM